MLRVVLSICAALLTLVAATGSFAMLPANPTLALTGGLLLLFAAFAVLRPTSSAKTPLRPMRLSLLASIPVTAYMLYGLAWPPRADEIGPFVTLLLALLLSVFALLGASHHPRAAFAALGTLGVLALISFPRYVTSLLRTSRTGTYDGPSIALSASLAGLALVGWLASFWYGRSLSAALHAPIDAT